MAVGTGADAALRTDYERVRDALRFDIVRGALAPGERLKVQEVMARYQVGANPVREAIQQLQGEGLVTVIPNRGAAVRALDEAFIRNVMEVRFALDAYFARRLAEAGGGAVLDRLAEQEAALEAALSEGDHAAAIERNIGFHREIILASGNDEALRALDRCAVTTRTIRRIVGYSLTRVEAIPREHRALLDAFARRDATAAMTIALDHARSAGEELLAQYLASRPAEARAAE
jgi:DNA-binding GntR family transcriptional regulator